jgi:iron complex transport system ATP-binding protein
VAAGCAPLVVRDLAVTLGGSVVLRGLNLELRRGELLALAGRNGAGKTTLVRAITRVVRPVSGSIHVLGDEVASLSPAALARRIAVLPQTAEVPHGFSAHEIALMGRTPHLGLLARETARDYAAVRRALQQTEIWELRDRRVETLSGGERQRLLLARALAQETPILLLDEPTAHLDLGRQAEVLDLVTRLRRECDLAVLAVLHDLTLAAQYGDRVALLADGRIAADGSPAEVLTEPVLAGTYGARVMVIQHPETGRPVVLPAAAQTGRVDGLDP